MGDEPPGVDQPRPDMNADAALSLLLEVMQLKLMPRTGWVMRGLTDSESVCDHSFGVAFVALILTGSVEGAIDESKVLIMALIHDLPEVVLGDIPSPASEYLNATAKAAAERDALGDLVGGLPARRDWERWWREFDEGTSPEGRLVRDADRLDMFLQAYVYEQTTGNRWLEEFWEDASRDSFEFPASQVLFDALCTRRQRDREAR